MWVRARRDRKCLIVCWCVVACAFVCAHACSDATCVLVYGCGFVARCIGGAQQASARYVNGRVVVAKWLSEPNGKIINAEVAYGICIEYLLPSGKQYPAQDWPAAPTDAAMKLTWRLTFERPCSEEPRSKVCVGEKPSSPNLDQVQKMLEDAGKSGF